MVSHLCSNKNTVHYFMQQPRCKDAESTGESLFAFSEEDVKQTKKKDSSSWSHRAMKSYIASETKK